MGLDISICTENFEEIYTSDYIENYSKKHSLSRSFCNLMCRRHVVNHEPELDQIGNITGVDISPFYEMEEYSEPDDLERILEEAPSEEEREKILKEIEEEQAQFQENLDTVLQTVSTLIEKLSTIENIPKLLLPTNFYSINNETYFARFKEDIGDGYIGNNFGQDLRNFKRFLLFSKESGAKKVWFFYC